MVVGLSEGIKLLQLVLNFIANNLQQLIRLTTLSSPNKKLNHSNLNSQFNYTFLNPTHLNLNILILFKNHLNSLSKKTLRYGPSSRIWIEVAPSFPSI